MFAVSAVDAVSPALERTRTFLFRPFRLSTYLKLCLVAVVTEGLGGNFNSSTRGGHTSHRNASVYSHFAWTPERIAVLVAMSLLVMLFLGFLFYLVTRLRFAWFHCLVHNTREIRPGWNLYRAPATRFFWLNLIVGFCFLLLMMLMALPFAAGFWALFRTVKSGGHPDMRAILALILPLIPAIFLLVIAAYATDLILRDLMLPHFALENATAGEAWRAVRTRILAEKGPFFVYSLLRVILPIAAVIALFIALILPGILFIASTAAVEVMIHVAFSHATGVAAMVGLFFQVFVALVAFSLALLVGIALGGPLSTALREYALLFYGGRYQRLGDILAPPPGGNPIVPGIA